MIKYRKPYVSIYNEESDETKTKSAISSLIDPKWSGFDESKMMEEIEYYSDLVLQAFSKKGWLLDSEEVSKYFKIAPKSEINPTGKILVTGSFDKSGRYFKLRIGEYISRFDAKDRVPFVFVNRIEKIILDFGKGKKSNFRYTGLN